MISFDIETTGLDPLNDEIIAIGLFDGGTEWIRVKGKNPNDEKEMIQKFIEYFKSIERDILGYNVGFDIDFIKIRALKYGIKISLFINSKFTDLFPLINSDSRKWGKLSDYAKLLELPGSYHLMGSLMKGQYERGNYENIKLHLHDDLFWTLDIYKRLRAIL